MESPCSQPDVAKTFPLVLTTGVRIVAYTHSQYRNLPKLRKIQPEPLVEINPIDAHSRGVQTGDLVAVSSLEGK